MGPHSTESCLRIGALHVSLDTARRWVVDYVSGPRTARSAYPAYDGYRIAERAAPLDEGDLLSPVLLNVGLTLDAYYWLAAQRDELNAMLARIDADVSLADDDDGPVRLAELFGVLDRRSRVDVRMTILSKVLHRKRPGLVPLYDANVRRCYAAVRDPRLEPDPDRSYAGFAQVLGSVIQADLRAGRVRWKDLATLADHPPITELRALDIVAWNLGGSPHAACDPACH